MKLRHLDWLGSVWKIDTVNPFVEMYDVKSNSFRRRHVCPYPVDLVSRLIVLYSKKGDLVLDPFCGSGTTNYASLLLFRKTVGYDFEEKYIRLCKEKCGTRATFYNKSSEQMRELQNESVSLCITSPPYLNLKIYSNNPNNLGNIKDPYPVLRKIFSEVFRVLKSEGYFCMNVGNVPAGDSLTTFPFDMIYMCQELGFKFRNTIIWDKGLHLEDYNVDNMRIRENHEFIWIFQKPPTSGGVFGTSSRAAKEECEPRRMRA